jgi:hypothetical protein
MPGREGDIWLAGDTGGLYHSTNSGASFSKVSTVTEAKNIGFGKAAPGQSYMALYLVGTVDGVTGVYRSDDAAGSWVRINDDRHQWGNMGEAITGDPRIFGRVYLGTNGRGIQYGDRISTSTPSVSPSSSASRSPSASASASVSPSRSSASPSGSPSGGTASCQVSYAITGQWGGGFQADVSITNTGNAVVNGWSLVWTFPNGQQINQIWNATQTTSGSTVTARNVSYNGTIQPGGSVSFGFLGSWSNANNRPTSFTLNGSACAVG